MHGTTHGWSFRVPPGWPIPPAGWTPPTGWQPDAAWPAAPLGWTFWVPSQPFVPAQRRTTTEDYWPTPRRSHGNRVVLMALYLVGLVGGWILLATKDLDGTFEKLQAGDAEVVQEPTEQPYGVRDCAFRDPAGNLIRIQERR